MLLLKGIIVATLVAVTNALDKTVCDSFLDTLDCSLGLILQINSVLYGRTQNNICNNNNVLFNNINCRSTSVSTQAVIKSCQGRNTCIVLADSSFLGEDPCPSTPKYLHVQYDCVYTLAPQSSTVSTRSSFAPTSTVPATTSSSSTPIPRTTSPLVTSFRSTSTSSGMKHASSRNQTNTGVGQCHEYLVSGPRGVPDGQLNASSQESISNNAHRGRLYTNIFKYQNGYYLEGAWTADPADTQPWIQVKMNWLTIVHGIVTQGRHVNQDTGCCAEWVTKYIVRYSLDGQTWETVKDSNKNTKEFVGNMDTDTPVTHIFDCPFVARFLRVEVVSYVGKASLRLDLFGCPTNAGFAHCISIASMSAICVYLRTEWQR